MQTNTGRRTAAWNEPTGYSQSLCGDLNFRSPIGGVVLVVVDVAVVWMKSPHNTAGNRLFKSTKNDSKNKLNMFTVIHRLMIHHHPMIHFCNVNNFLKKLYFFMKQIFLKAHTCYLSIPTV